ncbi:MAG: HlyD family efflux transporter periplasmic adaptor subunit [Gemmatimonadaceae bacterium]
MSTRLTQVALVATVLAMLPGCNRKLAADSAVGTLEMHETSVGPLQPARAERVLVQEGDLVHKGDTLAVFALPTLAASEDQALARAAAARQTQRDLSAGARPAEIAKSEDEIAAAQADVDRSTAELARLEPLAAKNIVSKSQLDVARAAARVATSKRNAAESALKLLREGTRPDRIAAALQDAKSAEAAAEMIRAAARDLILIAPIDGIVTSRHIEPGEAIAAGQNAITIGQPTRPWARIYVSQFALLKLKVGDSLSAHLDGDSTVHRGRIAAIASQAEYTPRVALTDQERADLLFGVKVEFVDYTNRLKAGLPITVDLPRTDPLPTAQPTSKTP